MGGNPGLDQALRRRWSVSPLRAKLYGSARPGIQSGLGVGGQAFGPASHTFPTLRATQTYARPTAEDRTRAVNLLTVDA